MVDPTCLAAFDVAMTPADTRGFLELYLRQAAARMIRIQELSAEGRLDAVAREAHSLICAAGNVGAERVSDLARSIESACRAGNPDDATRFVEELTDVSRITATALRAWLADRASEVAH